VSTTRRDIQGWFERGVRDGATHMLVLCDDYDYGDYPVYVTGGAEAARWRYQEYIAGKHPMQRVMEVYNLRGDMAAQLAVRRAYEF
jgi:hypothetical protein